MLTISKKLRIPSIVPILGVPLLIAAACGGDAAPPIAGPSSSTGGSGSPAAGGSTPSSGGAPSTGTGGTATSTGGLATTSGGMSTGTGGVAVASGGVSTQGGVGPASGGSSPGGSTSSGGFSATSGGSVAQGGAPQGGTPSAAGGAAMGGAPQGQGGMPAGGSGGASSLLEVAKDLNGKLLLGPCLTDTAKSVCQTFSGGCPAANKSDPALSGAITYDKSVMLGGDAGKSYTITLHVQGEVESKRYDGGADQNASLQSPKADGFCKGGTPTSGDAYNVYMIRVTPPGGTKTDYFLNSLQPPGVSNHTTYGIDYTARITAQGGSTVRLVAADSNCSMIKNCGPTENNGSVCSAPIIMQNIEPQAKALNPSFDFGKAYNGQWVVLVVTDVTSP